MKENEAKNVKVFKNDNLKDLPPNDKIETTMDVIKI